jgi:hypothetical protein
MSGSCDSQCNKTEFFANLKCPNCFSKEVSICRDEAGEAQSGECTLCDCQFELNPELKNIGME